MAKKRSSVKKKSSAKKRKGRKGGSGSAGWRRSPITGGVAGVIILLCLWFMLGSPDTPPPVKLDLICTAEGCDYQGRSPRPEGETSEPFSCPICNKKAVYQSRRCTNEDCGKITPQLPAKIDMTCKSCDHNKSYRLDPAKGPHPCPECNERALCETYQCRSCNHTFAYQVKETPGGNSPRSGNNGANDVVCPSCEEAAAVSLSENIDPSCIHCDSTKLVRITPSEVIKKELGRPLTSKDEQIIEAWEAKQQ